MEDTNRKRPNRLPSKREVASCTPIAAVWEITLSCNLKCAHCGSRAGAPRQAELSTSEALKLIRDMAEMGVRDVGLIGGEAYLRRDWLELVAAITRAGMSCSLQTGGRAFTAAKAAAAAAAGLASAGVSLDGLAANHDLVRGVPGSFEQAVNALRVLRAHGITTTVNTQLWAKSVGELRQLLHVIADLGATTWQLQLTVAMGNAADHPELLLQPYQMIDVMPLVAELYDEAMALGVRLVPGNNIGYFGPFEAKLRSIEELAVHWDGCSAGQNVIGIEADGNIKGCPSLATSDFTGGNVRDRPLADIWWTSRELGFARHATKDALWGFCKGCYYAEVCHGGCTWTAHSLFGRPGNNPYCHHRAITLQKEGLRERLRQIRAAPGVPFDNGLFELVVEDGKGNCVNVERPKEEKFVHLHDPIAPVRERISLLLCSRCDEFSLPHETRCHHCGSANLETLDERRWRAEDLAPLVQYLRSMLPAQSKRGRKLDERPTVSAPAPPANGP
jgi:radical SAM protein with 4Fe4S-binding SPASM domain